MAHEADVKTEHDHRLEKAHGRGREPAPEAAERAVEAGRDFALTQGERLVAASRDLENDAIDGLDQLFAGYSSVASGVQQMQRAWLSLWGQSLRRTYGGLIEPSLGAWREAADAARAEASKREPGAQRRH